MQIYFLWQHLCEANSGENLIHEKRKEVKKITAKSHSFALSLTRYIHNDIDREKNELLELAKIPSGERNESEME
jgi:hypothetical protein